MIFYLFNCSTDNEPLFSAQRMIPPPRNSRRVPAPAEVGFLRQRLIDPPQGFRDLLAHKMSLYAKWLGST